MKMWQVVIVSKPCLRDVVNDIRCRIDRTVHQHTPLEPNCAHKLGCDDCTSLSNIDNPISSHITSIELQSSHSKGKDCLLLMEGSEASPTLPLSPINCFKAVVVGGILISCEV